MTTSLLYQLLDTESGNYVGGFHSQAAALDSARAAFRVHGASYVSRLALTHTDERGTILDVLEGQELVERVRSVRAKS
jgi:hypothetical protein